VTSNLARPSCVAVVLVVALAVSGAARANGDPASDVLYVNDVFLPLSARVRPQLARELLDVTRTARKAGKPMKVALIASVTDLGLEPSYFGKPTDYARFLGAELQFLYQGKLLIVMPQGAGLSKAGRLVAEAAVVNAVIGSGVDGLARTAIDLVRELALGKPAAQSNSSTRSASGLSVWVWVAIAVGAVCALLVVGVVVRRRLSGRSAN
jgi:hypothetical protein